MASKLSQPSHSGSFEWLVCFAVREERAFFKPGPDAHVAILRTGMGQANAAAGIRNALSQQPPQGVITAGFAGGLNPALQCGQVVFDQDTDAGLAGRLQAAGATSARFHCAKHVAITAADKEALRRETGADAVEMESAVIRRLCREAGLPSATIRVISDAAHENLPLDFNALMTADARMNWWKLATTLIRHPRLVGDLRKFQQRTREAARELGRVLEQVVGR